jgi:type II secretory pathway predicted ATPase ExeA
MTERRRPSSDPLYEFFGFHSPPFSRDCPVDALLELPGQQEALARLQIALRNRDMVLLTGIGGSGKSTVLRVFKHQVDKNHVLPLYVPNPAPGLTGVYRDLLTQLGHEPTYFTPQLVSQLRVALADVATRGRRTVILFDDAHRLTHAWLEDLRMLLSTDMDASSLATLVLVGLPELRDRLRLAVHEPLWGRINIRCNLKPLHLEETTRYIHHHVKVAGYRGEALFSDGFVIKTYEYTRGVPRRINQVCLLALVAARQAQTQLIDERIFELVRLDLDGVDIDPLEPGRKEKKA